VKALENTWNEVKRRKEIKEIGRTMETTEEDGK
jgi:hypothetical protein